MSATCRIAHWVALLAGRRAAALVVFGLNLVHPLVHGTPLDGGALDGLLAWATAQAVSATND